MIQKADSVAQNRRVARDGPWVKTSSDGHSGSSSNREEIARFLMMQMSRLSCVFG